MNDYIIRATAADNQIRAFAATTTELVKYAQKAHGTDPISTIALGRLLTAGSMMGVMLKGSKDLLTLQIKGSNYLRNILVTADSKGNVKGYLDHEESFDFEGLDKVTVGKAIGEGTLSVFRDLGLNEPYVSRIDLQTGEIAEDLTYYYAHSEQVPTSLGLGVYLDGQGQVESARGFIIQLMPNPSPETVAALESNLRESLMLNTESPENILEKLLKGFDVEILQKIPTRFYCNCSREKTSEVLACLSTKDLREMVEENKPVQLNCSFCNQNYQIDLPELKLLLENNMRNKYNIKDILD